MKSKKNMRPMDIDKKTIKALASETRLGILKGLSRRRMMPAELSKILSLSPSTISEHLGILENAGLIKKKDTGHKWIYYELTEKSNYVFGGEPQTPIKFILSVSIGIIFIAGGILNFLSSRVFYVSEAVVTQIPGTTVRTAQPLAPLIDISVFLIVIGIALIAIGFLKWKF